MLKLTIRETKKYSVQLCDLSDPDIYKIESYKMIEESCCGKGIVLKHMPR